MLSPNLSMFACMHLYEINGLGVKQAERLIMVISQQYSNILSGQLLLGVGSHFLAAWRCALTNVPFTEL